MTMETIPGNRAVTTGKPDRKEEKKESKCPRCDKLEESELKAVFPKINNPQLIKEIVDSFNKYCKKFNVNTCTLKAHFFAQAKQESGDSLSPAILGENMDYSVNGLLTTGFKNVSSKYIYGNKNGIEMAKELGRKKEERSLSIDRQVKVANFVYGLNPKAKDLGNKAPSDNKSLSEEDNEGWKYKGRGMLQITGKGTYINVENHVNSILKTNILNISSGRKSTEKFTPTEALLSGFGDWDLHKMYIPAKAGLTKEACINVIKIINSATKSKTKRIAHLIGGKWYENDDKSTKAYIIKEKDSMKSIFRVNECILNKKQ
jgi:predicted chitinase